MANFFKRHYLNDAKLAQRALLEFHRALSSGRLIAFTGSMTTEPCGYGSWTDLVEAYARLAGVARTRDNPKGAWTAMKAELAAIARRSGEALQPDSADPMIANIQRYLRTDEGKKLDARVALGLFEEIVLGHESASASLPHGAGDWDLDTVGSPLDLLSVAIAHYFREPHRKRTAKLDSEADVVAALLDGLGVRRIATLNYDFELESRLMLADVAGEGSAFDRLRGLRARARGEVFDWSLSSGRIRRVLASGQAIESDILNRERIDRMLEFAIGADDVDAHVLHLHGRACSAASMILSYRDYDRLYRRNDLSKLPFEFAQRILMGGNPILFVGVGMSETEINQALQDFVSSSPYQRVAPTFLLWNTSEKERDPSAGISRMEMRRLDWLHRLGVLAIFDADLPPDAKVHPADDPSVKLARLIRTLPKHARRIADREAFTGGPHWRHMGVKAHARDSLTVMWEVAERSLQVAPGWGPDNQRAHRRMLRSLGHAAPPVLCVIGSQGCGKGSFARFVADNADRLGVDVADTLLINGGFSFDTDSLLDGIARFLDARMQGSSYTKIPGGPPLMSRSAFFRSLTSRRSRSPRRPLLIVLNGGERFFSISGALLSAELDELLRLVAIGSLPDVRLVVFGTARVRTYMRDALHARIFEASDLGLDPIGKTQLPVQRLDAIRRAFSKTPVAKLAPGRDRVLWDVVAAVKASSAAQISGDSADLRRAFFDLYLEPTVLSQALGKDRLGLAMELLRALAFIGLPVERDVLHYVPRIRTAPDHKTWLKLIPDVLDRLVELGLVLELVGHRGAPDEEVTERYTLPRMLLSDLRARFSIPLSEAKLSTAFNMSLYVAQPADGYIPEPDIHDELGLMIDRLLGAYRDMAAEKETKAPTTPDPVLTDIVKDLMPHEHRELLHRSEHAPKHGRRDMERELETVASPANIHCLRAALALIRGYYTTTDLLTLDIADRLIREDRDGVLLEHAERLDGLIDAYGKVAVARSRLRKTFKGSFDKRFGAVEPLYPDELVWLHNERGVIRLAMGDLYEARASFLRALDINTLHVERRDRSHNWRRIRLNQLTVDLEGGEIGLALRKIEELLEVSDRPAGEAGHEDLLAIGLATGYRGWARHLQGEAALAREDYDAAIAILAREGEARAQVYFLRLRCSLFNGLPERARELDGALDLALATRQMDLVYRLRVLRALDVLAAPSSEDKERDRARRVLDVSQRYALQTDVHRVRVESGMVVSEACYLTGDYEGALRAASDAMMVATRFGMELRKIALRSVMARIMAARGHPVTATKLATTAIRIGSRRRYLHAIKHAEATLEKIPRISAIMDVIDVVDRRQP